jgi:hypothetical protein
MKEIIFYAIVAVSALFILGFSIHMLIGGIVSPQTERSIIIGACLIGVAVIGAMATDVIRRRRSSR